MHHSEFESAEEHLLLPSVGNGIDIIKTITVNGPRTNSGASGQQQKTYGEQDRRQYLFQLRFLHLFRPKNLVFPRDAGSSKGHACPP